MTTAASSVINVGTTNTDGTGSATNLSVSAATASLIDFGSTSVDGSQLYNIDIPHGQTVTILSVDTWNKAGFKEAQIHNDSDIVIVDNFVDVDIDNTNTSGSEIYLYNSKRGNITTSDGDDTIEIGVYTNNSGWVNKFTIDSGAGNDSILMTNVQNSKYTSFDIDVGSGNDKVDVSGLSSPYASSVSRLVDGGEGIDTLVISDSSVSFSNFEVVVGSKSDFGTSIAITSDLLASNASDFGLVFSNIDVSFASGFEFDAPSMLSADQAHYLDSLGLDTADYVSLTTHVDDVSYTVLTDDHSYTMPV
jgi:hypothetical protein